MADQAKRRLLVIMITIVMAIMTMMTIPMIKPVFGAEDDSASGCEVLVCPGSADVVEAAGVPVMTGAGDVAAAGVAEVGSISLTSPSGIVPSGCELLILPSKP